jgi:hypothetical protein
MATLHKEILIEARPEQVWDAVRDIGALHTRLVPGFVIDTQLEGDARIVTSPRAYAGRPTCCHMQWRTRSTRCRNKASRR